MAVVFGRCLSARGRTAVSDDNGWRNDALEWVGRRVRIVDGPSAENNRSELGTVICVDATDYRPSAWVKITDERREGGSTYGSYRSCDLCWLEDVETAESGPVWCRKPDSAEHGELDGLVLADRIRSVAAQGMETQRAETENTGSVAKP